MKSKNAILGRQQSFFELRKNHRRSEAEKGKMLKDCHERSHLRSRDQSLDILGIKRLERLCPTTSPSRSSLQDGTTADRADTLQPATAFRSSMPDPPARNCWDMRQVQMQAKGSPMSLAAAVADPQHVQKPAEPMFGERKPKAAAATLQHMQEPDDPMVRERKLQALAATLPHMQEAPVNPMIRERTMCFKGKGPQGAQCPFVKSIAAKAADPPHISGIKPLDLISNAADSWDKSKALPFESYATSSFVGAGVIFKNTPDHKLEETYLEASSVSFGPPVQEESHHSHSKVQYKAKAGGSKGSSDTCSFTKNNLQPLSSDPTRNFMVSGRAQAKQEKYQKNFSPVKNSWNFNSSPGFNSEEHSDQERFDQKEIEFSPPDILEYSSLTPATSPGEVFDYSFSSSFEAEISNLLTPNQGGCPDNVFRTTAAPSASRTSKAIKLWDSNWWDTALPTNSASREIQFESFAVDNSSETLPLKQPRFFHGVQQVMHAHNESGELSKDDKHMKAQNADVNTTSFSADSFFDMTQPMAAHSLTNLHMFNGRVDIKNPSREAAIARGTGRTVIFGGESSYFLPPAEESGMDSWIDEEDSRTDTLIRWKADQSPTTHCLRDSTFLSSSANANTLMFKDVISSEPDQYLVAPVQVLEAVESHGDLNIDRSFLILGAPQIRYATNTTAASPSNCMEGFHDHMEGIGDSQAADSPLKEMQANPRMETFFCQVAHTDTAYKACILADYSLGVTPERLGSNASTDYQRQSEEGKHGERDGLHEIKARNGQPMPLDATCLADFATAKGILCHMKRPALAPLSLSLDEEPQDLVEKFRLNLNRQDNKEARLTFEDLETHQLVGSRSLETFQSQTNLSQNFWKGKEEVDLLTRPKESTELERRKQWAKEPCSISPKLQEVEHLPKRSKNSLRVYKGPTTVESQPEVVIQQHGKHYQMSGDKKSNLDASQGEDPSVQQVRENHSQGAQQAPKDEDVTTDHLIYSKDVRRKINGSLTQEDYTARKTQKLDTLRPALSGSNSLGTGKDCAHLHQSGSQQSCAHRQDILEEKDDAKKSNANSDDKGGNCNLLPQSPSSNNHST